MRKLVTLFISLIYAALLASAPMEGVMDRDNYLEMARVSPLIIARYIGQGAQSVIANEPVWLAINSALGFVFDDDVF